MRYSSCIGVDARTRSDTIIRQEYRTEQRIRSHKDKENEQGAVAFTGGSLFSAVRLTAKIRSTGEYAPKSSLQMFSLAEKIRFSQKFVHT